MSYARFLEEDPEPDLELVGLLALLPKDRNSDRLDETDLRVISIASTHRLLLSDDGGFHSSGVRDILADRKSPLRIYRYSAPRAIEEIESLCEPSEDIRGVMDRRAWALRERDYEYIGRTYHVRWLEKESGEAQITYAHETNPNPREFSDLVIGCDGEDSEVLVEIASSRIPFLVQSAQFDESPFEAVTFESWQDRLAGARSKIATAKSCLSNHQPDGLQSLSELLENRGCLDALASLRRYSDWLGSFASGSTVDHAREGSKLAREVVLDHLAVAFAPDGEHEPVTGKKRKRSDVINLLRKNMPAEEQGILDLYRYTMHWLTMHEWCDIPFEQGHGEQFIMVSLKGRLGHPSALRLFPTRERALRRLRLFGVGSERSK